MEHFGMNTGFLLMQLCNLSILLVWFVAAIVALFQLRTADLPATPKAVWAALVCLVPVLGAMAFFIVRPGESTPQS
ncbi:MAG: hypothetical protein Fur0018_13180 [Anaerolineales bacterium]